MSDITVDIEGRPVVVPTGETAAAALDRAGALGDAIGARLDGEPIDLKRRLDADGKLERIAPDSPDGLEILRHSTAHLLAQAVKRLFPTAQVTIGPVIEDGFYYDFAFERAFTPEDLASIEKEMKKIAREKHDVVRAVESRDEAIGRFETEGEAYKAEIIRDLPADETLTLYTQGEFTDLCRGPHVSNTKRLSAF